MFADVCHSWTAVSHGHCCRTTAVKHLFVLATTWHCLGLLSPCIAMLWPRTTLHFAFIPLHIVVHAIVALGHGPIKSLNVIVVIV
jgi:hypothetical protein